MSRRLGFSLFGVRPIARFGSLQACRLLGCRCIGQRLIGSIPGSTGDCRLAGGNLERGFAIDLNFGGPG